jgi:hypothetical protein
LIFQPTFYILNLFEITVFPESIYLKSYLGCSYGYRLQV